MARNNVDIIAQLRDIVERQHDTIMELTDSVGFWRSQAMTFLERDIEAAMGIESRLEMVELRDLGSEA